MSHQFAITAELVINENTGQYQIQYYLGPHLFPFADPISLENIGQGNLANFVGEIASRRMEHIKAFFDAIHGDTSVTLTQTLEGEVQ